MPDADSQSPNRFPGSAAVRPSSSGGSRTARPCRASVVAPRKAPQRLRFSSGTPKRRRYPQRKAFREALRREAANLFLFKIAQRYVAGGFSLGMVARMMKGAPSWLCHLNNLYQEGGCEAIAPNLLREFPCVLSMSEDRASVGETQTGGKLV